VPVLKKIATNDKSTVALLGKISENTACSKHGHQKRSQHKILRCVSGARRKRYAGLHSVSNQKVSSLMQKQRFLVHVI